MKGRIKVDVVEISKIENVSEETLNRMERYRRECFIEDFDEAAERLSVDMSETLFCGDLGITIQLVAGNKHNRKALALRALKILRARTKLQLEKDFDWGDATEETLLEWVSGEDEEVDD